MITEAKLHRALKQLGRRRARGPAMGGLSIPAEYYFRGKATKAGVVTFPRKARARMAATVK